MWTLSDSPFPSLKKTPTALLLPSLLRANTILFDSTSPIEFFFSSLSLHRSHGDKTPLRHCPLLLPFQCQPLPIPHGTFFPSIHSPLPFWPPSPCLLPFLTITQVDEIFPPTNLCFIPSPFGSSHFVSFWFPVPLHTGRPGYEGTHGFSFSV